MISRERAYALRAMIERAAVSLSDADGGIWVSTVDANVWVPGVYGWEEEQ